MPDPTALAVPAEPAEPAVETDAAPLGRLAAPIARSFSLSSAFLTGICGKLEVAVAVAVAVDVDLFELLAFSDPCGPL